MAIRYEKRMIKCELPNEETLDLSQEFINKIMSYRQFGAETPEAGGYLVGYQLINDSNYVLEDITTPYRLDLRNRYGFIIRDFRHKIHLMRLRKNGSFYMGVWHSHPQRIPEPSNIDINDWNETVKIDKTGCRYVFFIILGYTHFRIWCGDLVSNKIVEINEREKKGDIYE